MWRSKRSCSGNSDCDRGIDEEISRAIAKLADMPKLLERMENGEQEPGGGYNMCAAIDEMMEESREEGREEGRDKVNRLVALLMQNNRLDDLLRSTEDKCYQQKLFVEFEI